MRRRVGRVVGARADTVRAMAGRTTGSVPNTGRGNSSARCSWCARELPSAGSIGRRRRYCAQACRQRAYENRHALLRGDLPADAVMLSVEDRDDLADRLYQLRCAAEDVATAVAEGASGAELGTLVEHLLRCTRQAEHIR